MKKLLIPLFLLLLVNAGWNIYLYSTPDKQTVFNYLFNVSYSLIFMYGAFVAFTAFKQYSFATPIGKSLLFYAISLSAYALGLIVWAYYNVIIKVEVPYPGLPDLFFVLFQPFSAISFYYLVKSYGGKFTNPRLIELGILSLVLFFILYSFLKISSLGSDLPLMARILNISYPLLDAFLAALAIIGLRTEKGALHPNLLTFVFAALAMVFADTAFAYRSAAEIYWNGDFADTGFMISATLFTYGLINLAGRLKNERTTQSL
jgi:hypothetical protein